jgi:hypothetical protein
MMAAIDYTEFMTVEADRQLVRAGALWYEVRMPPPSQPSGRIYVQSRIMQDTGVLVCYGFANVVDWHLAGRLQQVDGISLRLASLVVQRVGAAEIYAAAESADAKRLSSKVPGLGPKRAGAILTFVVRVPAPPTDAVSSETLKLLVGAAQEVDTALRLNAGTGYNDLELILNILRNRQELNAGTGTFTIYDDNCKICNCIFHCSFSVENCKELFFSHFHFPLYTGIAG